MAVTFDFSGPVVSAFISWNPPTPSKGINATVNATIPIPPSQFVRQRHKLMLLGKVSMLLKIVAPVVANPLTLSKIASVKFGIAPEKYKGIEPKRLVKIQQQATTRYV